MTDPTGPSARQQLSSKSRNVVPHRGQSVVSLRYDTDGKPLTPDTFDARRHVKTLDQKDWMFLECWKRHGYNAEKAAHELDLGEYDVKRLVKKLDCFRTEEIRDKALATIPSVEYIKARHVESLLSDKEHKLEESDHKSLAELAKIQGAYKTAATLNIQNNFFAKPQLTPEQEKATREFFDTIAIEEQKHVA